MRADPPIYTPFGPRGRDTHELVEALFGAFDDWCIIGVFRRKSDGALFWACDFGCSCSQPWDELSVAHLTPFNHHTFHRFREVALDLVYVNVADAHSYAVRMFHLLQPTDALLGIIKELA